MSVVYLLMALGGFGLGVLLSNYVHHVRRSRCSNSVQPARVKDPLYWYEDDGWRIPVYGIRNGGVCTAPIWPDDYENGKPRTPAYPEPVLKATEGGSG